MSTQKAKDNLLWPIIWRTVLILLPVTIVLQLFGVFLRESVGIPIHQGYISAGIGGCAMPIMWLVRQRLQKKREDEASPASPGD